MGAGGFGTAYEAPTIDYKTVLRFVDGSNREYLGWITTGRNATQRAIDDVSKLYPPDYDIAGFPAPLETFENPSLSLGRVRFQKIEPGRINGPRHRVCALMSLANKRKVSDNGPGNLADKK